MEEHIQSICSVLVKATGGANSICSVLSDEDPPLGFVLDEVYHNKYVRQ